MDNNYGLPNNTFWRVSVKVLVRDDAQRILVLKNGDNEWEMPGGGWEHEETLEQCVERELVEEVGVRPLNVGQILFSYTGKTDKGFPKLSIVVSAELDGEINLESSQEIVESKFVDKNEFLALNFQTSEMTILNKVDLIWPDVS